jgi:hypothetical protein
MYHQLKRFSARKLELVTVSMKNRSLQQEVALSLVKEDKMALVIRSNIRTRNYPESLLCNPTKLSSGNMPAQNGRKSGSAIYSGLVPHRSKAEEQTFEEILDDLGGNSAISNSDSFPPALSSGNFATRLSNCRSSASVPSVSIEGIFLAQAPRHIFRIYEQNCSTSSSKTIRKSDSNRFGHGVLERMNQEAALTAVNLENTVDGFTKYDVSTDSSMQRLA